MLPRARPGSVIAMTALVLVAACGGAAKPSTSAPASAPSASASRGSEEPADVPPDGPPRNVDCGDFTTCAIGKDGLVRCWGHDKQGELGDGNPGAERLERGVVRGVTKATKTAVASRFGCAILEDKRVKCWGTGRILNDGRALTGAKPALVEGVEGAEEIVASGAIACARTATGTVCWGADAKTIGTPPKTAFTQISAGFTHACGLDASGAVACWGQGDWGGGGLFAKPGVSGATQVVSGDRHACVLTKAKTVACWGMNDAGQLGVKADMDPHKKPALVPGVSGVTRVIAGEASTCAVLGDGSVRCWGSNGEGELGLGTRSSDERPARVPGLSDVEDLCLASAHGCALTKQGKLLCWGSNAYGQIGDGTKERRPTPTAVLW